MPSAWADISANCALVGEGLEDSTLGFRRQASGGKNRSVDDKTRKCFTFNKQRQRRGQGLQQGLATIPENSVYMTGYDQKGIRICKERAREEKKCRLVDQKHEKKRRILDDKHIKYQQYLAQLALRRSEESTRSAENTPCESNEWRTVRRHPLGLSAVSHERVVTADDPVVNGNQHFSEKFLDFENSDEVLFSGVNKAMAVVAPGEYAHMDSAVEVTENHACVAQKPDQENVKRNCVSFSSVVDELADDDTQADGVKVNHEKVKGRMCGQSGNRSIWKEQATGTSAVSLALASVGMGCRTGGDHAREAASSVEELKRSRKVPVDFHEALKEHNAILLEMKTNETFNLKPRKEVSARSMRVKKRTVVIPSEVGYQPDNPPRFCQAFVGKAQDDSRLGNPCRAKYDDRLSEWTPWEMHLQVRDENQFVYRRRGELMEDDDSSEVTVKGDAPREDTPPIW